MLSSIYVFFYNLDFLASSSFEYFLSKKNYYSPYVPFPHSLPLKNLSTGGGGGGYKNFKV